VVWVFVPAANIGEIGAVMKQRRGKMKSQSDAVGQETRAKKLTSPPEAGAPKLSRHSSKPTQKEKRLNLLNQPPHPLETFLESFNDGMFEFDFEGTLLNFWGSRQGLLHPQARKGLGRRARELMTRGTFEPFRKAFARVLETGQSEDVEYDMQLPEGRRWFLARIIPVPRTHRGRNTICLLARNITPEKDALEALRKKEGLWKQAEQLAKLGSWDYDVEKQSFIWSDQMYRMLEREPGNERIPLGQACAIFHPDDRARVAGDVQTVITEGKPLENELRFLLPDGRIRVFQSRAVPVADATGRVHEIRGMSQDITDRKQAEEEQRRLSQQLLNVRDEEHRRLARDLHESASQSLAALKMTLSRLAEAVPQDATNQQDLLQSSLTLAEEAIREVRTVSHLLHPLMLDEAGLGPALRWYAAGFSERSRVAVMVEIADDFGRLPQETETAIFHIVQEALTNVHRHSGSSTAVIRVARRDGCTLVEVEDKGRGMSLPSELTGWHSPMGIGLAGIRQRVKQLEGEFEIKSALGDGTTIRVVLPVAKAAAAG
jgi:signal transduction histidine kinase